MVKNQLKSLQELSQERERLNGVNKDLEEQNKVLSEELENVEKEKLEQASLLKQQTSEIIPTAVQLESIRREVRAQWEEEKAAMKEHERKLTFERAKNKGLQDLVSGQQSVVAVYMNGESSE